MGNSVGKGTKSGKGKFPYAKATTSSQGKGSFSGAGKAPYKNKGAKPLGSSKKTVGKVK